MRAFRISRRTPNPLDQHSDKGLGVFLFQHSVKLLLSTIVQMYPFRRQLNVENLVLTRLAPSTSLKASSSRTVNGNWGRSHILWWRHGASELDECSVSARVNTQGAADKNSLFHVYRARKRAGSLQCFAEWRPSLSETTNEYENTLHDELLASQCAFSKTKVLRKGTLAALARSKPEVSREVSGALCTLRLSFGMLYIEHAALDGYLAFGHSQKTGTTWLIIIGQQNQ